MNINPIYVGPNYEAIRKKEYENHLSKMNEIMNRKNKHHEKPIVLTDDSVKQREKTIDEENHKIFQRLWRISNRKIQDNQSARQSQVMQRYKALLRKRKMQKIRQQNLSLADRLTKRMTGGYSILQRSIEQLRESKGGIQRPVEAAKLKLPHIKSSAQIKN